MRRLKNEKSRERRLLLDYTIAKYNKEQLECDRAQQLSGERGNGDVAGVPERLENRTPEHVLLIDAIMTLPGRSFGEEVQRRIRSINAVTTYCGVEEGGAYGRQAGLSERSGSGVPNLIDEKPISSDSDDVLNRAILSVRTEKRPLICFLYVGNATLPMCEQVKKYAR